VLNALRIADFAILAAAEFTLGPGLTAITGETGAGKSLLVEALLAVLGGRAGEKVVRQGRETAEIEALFEGEPTPRLRGVLEELGLHDDDGALVLRRVIARNGKGRCHVNGRLVTTGQLRTLGQGLCDLAVQHAQHRLLQPQAQLEALDRFGGLGGARREHAVLHTAWWRARARLAELVERQRARAERLDWLRFVHKELTDARVRPGEMAEVQSKLTRLKAAERVVRGLHEAAGFAGGDGGAAAQLGRAVRVLQRLAGLDVRIDELAGRLEDLEAMAADLARDIQLAGRGVQRDEAEQGRLAERVDLLQRVFRKYGGSEESTLERLAQVTEELDGDTAELRSIELQREVQKARNRLVTASESLTERRVAAAPKLAREATQILRDLGMTAAELRVHLRPVDGDPAPTGSESAALWLAANTGEAGGALHEVASGGELARVLLSIQHACARAQEGDGEVPATALYDEIDAGLSGSVGLVLGKFLRQVGERGQVVVVSHLPQVAAAAHAHLQVTKHDHGGRTVARVQALDGNGRVRELARMLGEAGEKATAVQHARELLDAQGG
jgi:DNA repair protein RecN (Recombination protein N)